jgi:hypothetical protein
MKYIKDWERILLDTTALCSLFRSENTTEAHSQDVFVRRLIEWLNNKTASSGHERIFLVSAITIAELTTNEDDSEKIKRVMRVLNSKNVEFIDFDLEVAMSFNLQLKKYLNSESLHKKAQEVGFKTNDFAMAREWITKDYMIIMCGINNGADVILTADKNTFYPIAKDIQHANCVLTYPELFEYTDQHFLGYKETEVEAFLTPQPTEKKVTPKKIKNGEPKANPKASPAKDEEKTGLQIRPETGH